MFYEKRFKEMPMKVLLKHGIITRNGDLIHLSMEKVGIEQRAELKRICEEKIQEHVASRGIAIWDYAMLDSNPVPDSLRYRVLKEANGRCALCGVTKIERPIDVDHIIPRSWGGKTEYSNLQALCSKCNRSKQDKDNTDFRKPVTASRVEGCVFCEPKNDGEKMLENSRAYAMLDTFPVSKGHTLIIPKRHFGSYFEMTMDENDAIFDLVRVKQKQLLEEDHSVLGFNIGVNSGEVAGQTVFHCHVHLIPRRSGDVQDPRGGVRSIIPSMTNYP